VTCIGDELSSRNNGSDSSGDQYGEEEYAQDDLQVLS
jgi:hypothetical protein